MLSITLVACRRIEIGMNENSGNFSFDASCGWRHDIQVAGNYCVPKWVDELILVVQNALCARQHLKLIGLKIIRLILTVFKIELTCCLSMIVPPQRGWFGVPGERMKTADGNSPRIAKAPPVKRGALSSAAIAVSEHTRRIKSFIFFLLCCQVGELCRTDPIRLKQPHKRDLLKFSKDSVIRQLSRIELPANYW